MEVLTKATGPRSAFANNLAQMQAAAEEEVYGVLNMTTDQHVKCQVHLSHAETEATTSSITDMFCVEKQLKRVIYGITANEQMRFPKKFAIWLIARNDL